MRVETRQSKSGRDTAWLRGPWGFATVWFAMPVIAGFMLALAVGMQTAFTLWAGYILALTIVGMCLYEQYAPRVVDAMEAPRPDDDDGVVALPTSALTDPPYVPEKTIAAIARSHRILDAFSDEACPVKPAIDEVAGVVIAADGDVDPLEALSAHVGFPVDIREAIVLAHTRVPKAKLSAAVRVIDGRSIAAARLNVLA